MKIDWTYATLVALSIAIIVSSVILKYTVNRQRQVTEDFDNGVNMLGSSRESSYDNAFGDSRTFATQNFGWDDGLNAEFNTWFHTPKDIPGGGIDGNSFDAPPAPSGSGSCRWVCDADDMNQYRDDLDDRDDVTQYPMEGPGYADLDHPPPMYRFADETHIAQNTRQTVFDDDGSLNDDGYGPYTPSDDGRMRWDGRGSNGQCAPGYEWDGQECLNMSQAARDNGVAIWTPGPSPLPPSGPLPGPAPAPVPTPGPTPKPGPKPASKGTWVPLTSYVATMTASAGSNFTATYIDPVTKKSVTLTGRPYGSCPDSPGACVAKAGDGGSILVSPTGIIDGRPKPGPVKKSTLIQGTVTSNPSSNHFVATYKVGAATKTYAFTNTTGFITKNRIVALTVGPSGIPTGVSTIFPARGNGSFNVRDFSYQAMGLALPESIMGTVTSNPSPDHFVATYTSGTSKTPKTYAFTNTTGKITKNQSVKLSAMGPVIIVETIFPARPKGVRNTGNFMYTK